ncbi:unnamed protein product [Microthlaspi erraticum]|uniref:K-box domain-containing protein n=1 Tax=Microthlaspi erraticum TaxID=1685480 RepID=A0A6D2I1S6_9BRAS|nr:unnamed protein product [Microthlaspi erraticum]
MSKSCESSRSLQEHDHEANETFKSFQLLDVDDSESVREMPCSSKFSRISHRSERSLPKQEDLVALRDKAETLRSELEDLQILNDNMCAEGIDALSVAELRSLLGPLEQGLLSVETQVAKKRIEQEEIDRRMVKQEFGEEGDTDDVKLWIQSKRDQSLDLQLLAAKKRSFFRRTGRERRRSTESRKHWDDHETLVQAIKKMKREIPILQLWNRRMCGEDIDGMDFFELLVLRRQINIGRVYIRYWVLEKGGKLGNYESIGGENEHGGERRKVS